jgi:DMSO/TMAO reductase YedYZ molybdopterin-dependent catalytic subunit
MSDDRRDLASVAAEGAVAALAGVAAVAGSYAAVGRVPAFVATPLSRLVVATTPDAVVAWSIQTLGDLGHQLGFLLALVLTAGAFAVVVAFGALSATRAGAPRSPVAALGCVALALALTGAPSSALAAGAGAGIVVALAGVDVPAGESVSGTRRRVLQAVVGAVAVGGVSAALGRRQDAAGPPEGGPVGEDVAALLADAESKSLDVGGIEGLVSEEFYQVDINSVDPAVAAEDWTLTLTGAVDEKRTFDYADVTDLPSEHRFVTLRCVGEGLNGKKMDTALWTGVPLMELLGDSALPDECCVMFRAADDYFEEFPLAALENAFLAYEMNGEPLPRAHGYPVRALIPGHWGEINVKWLTEIEVLEAAEKGYWERRGWHGTGPVNTVAKLHAVNDLDDGRVQVGGHAYAGTRGVDRVEVSVDGGRTWADATLSDPLPGEDVWRQWEHSYAADGEHEVVVRATDGEGNLQTSEESGPKPSGPTGWVSKRVDP